MNRMINCGLISRYILKTNGENQKFCAFVRRMLSDSKVLDDSDPRTKQIKKELTDLHDKKLYEEYGQEDYGWIYDKKPFKYECKAGKAYVWCACGRSHKQPFCDGTHNIKQFKITLKPIRWDCTETKEYWFCNCKQTKHRPFCDGTHKLEFVQTALTTIRTVHSPPMPTSEQKGKWKKE